jgi:hypothetical protein
MIWTGPRSQLLAHPGAAFLAMNTEKVGISPKTGKINVAQRENYLTLITMGSGGGAVKDRTENTPL